MFAAKFDFTYAFNNRLPRTGENLAEKKDTRIEVTAIFVDIVKLEFISFLIWADFKATISILDVFFQIFFFTYVFINQFY